MEIIGKTKKKILKQIENEPLHGYKLSSTLNLSLSTVYGHLKDLKSMGLIKEENEPNRNKKYILTEKGKELIKIFEK